MKKLQFLRFRFFGKILVILGLLGGQVAQGQLTCFDVSSLMVTNVLCNQSTGSVSFSVSYGGDNCDCINPNFIICTITSGGESISDTMLNNGQFSFGGLLPGAYDIELTAIKDANACTETGQDFFTINPPPNQISLSSQTITNVVCFGENTGAINIIPTGAPPSSTYLYSWNTPGIGNSPTASNLPAGNYSVTITATGNAACGNTFNFQVNSLSTAVSVELNKKDACDGEANGTITASASGGYDEFTYAWSNGQTGAIIIGLGMGNYTVTATDSKGCEGTATSSISELPALMLILPSIPSITSGTSEIITFSSNGNVYWQITDTSNINGDLLGELSDDSKSFSKIFTLAGNRSPGVVVFQVFPHHNDFANLQCPGDTQTLTIFVKPEADDTPFIPEIYTPNGDGQNDVWQVAMPDGVEMGEYTIFNRLGGKVYAGDTLTPWDGSGCPDGPYFYVLRYEQDGEEKVVKGAVTILRTTD